MTFIDLILGPKCSDCHCRIKGPKVSVPIGGWLCPTCKIKRDALEHKHREEEKERELKIKEVEEKRRNEEQRKRMEDQKRLEEKRLEEEIKRELKIKEAEERRRNEEQRKRMEDQKRLEEKQRRETKQKLNELQIKSKDQFGNEYVSCPSLQFQIDVKEHPGLLGVVCPDGVFWIHHGGVKEFIPNIFSWAKYVAAHPECKELPSSMQFRSCIKETEGCARYGRVYEFTRDAVLTAMPLVINTWKIFHLPDPSMAAETGLIVRNLSTERMASRGATKLGVNDIFLALMHFNIAVDHMRKNFPEGIDFSTTLRAGAQLEEVFSAFHVTLDRVAQQLEARLPQGQSYNLQPSMMIMFDPETQEFYANLKRLTGGREKTTALEMLVVHLMKPSREIAEVLSAVSINIEQLAERARKALLSSP